jgi:hypothetical protein
VTEFHGWVGLRPGLRSLTQLQRGLVRNAHRHPAAQESEVRRVQCARWQRLGQRGSALIDHRAEIFAQPGPPQCQGGGRKPGLNNRLLVREVQDHVMISKLDQWCVSVRSDPERTGFPPAPQGLEQPKYLCGWCHCGTTRRQRHRSGWSGIRRPEKHQCRHAQNVLEAWRSSGP